MQKDQCKRVFAVTCRYGSAPQSLESTPEVPSVLGFALSLEGLFAQVSLDLLAEHQHAQVGVRGLVHGFGLDAHAVLLRRQLVRALLLVPQVEEAGHGGPDHDQVAPEVLPVQVDVLHAPAFHLEIKPSWRNYKPVCEMKLCFNLIS